MQVTEDLEANSHGWLSARLQNSGEELAATLHCIYGLIWVLNRNYLPAFSYNETSKKAVSSYI